MQKTFYLLLGTVGTLFAEQKESCPQQLPVPCNVEECKLCYCLGPENIAANTPVRPKTCNGDWVITVAGLYWNAHQDGMEYAIDTAVTIPPINPFLANIQQLNTLIDAKYLTPSSNWEFGYKLGLSFNTSCDGWDIGAVWTHFDTRSFTHIEAEMGENHTLIPLWSAFVSSIGSVLFARDIETAWKLHLDLVDVEMGREYWISRYISMHPHIGFRYAEVDQDFDLSHKGGSWSPRTSPDQDAFNNEVNLDNHFKGAGLISGLDTVWHLGCGWAIYSNGAVSIIYGRFNIDHDEENRLTMSPHTIVKILSTESHFRASRAILNYMLGIQWASLFCDCKYGITAKLGWEHYLFFHQNQLWRVNRINAAQNILPNNTGENDFSQRRGNLNTQGWTLTFVFEF